MSQGVPRVADHQQKLGDRDGTVSSAGPPGGTNPADTWSQTSGLLDSERINFHWFRPPSL